ncbi:sphingomyelin phosphodiesterase 4-like isoform X2 [Hydractinia symbiolongicarpus]|nr:sphingomyelin phosphodiesterase 4-like isoform X2 [Hydractinia symbiolongicarpus]
MMQQEAYFQFPCTLLPVGIAEFINKKGQMSAWFEKKIIVLPDNKAVINFDAMEYFLALFACYVMNPEKVQDNNHWSNIDDILYVRILEDYLKSFFPIPEEKNSRTKSVPSTSMMTADLWKSHHAHESSASNHQFNLIQSESFLQILCDFWLTLNTEEFTQLDQEYKLPSLNHSHVVRILVKYLHSFVNSTFDQQQIQSLVSVNYSYAHVEELKSIVLPAALNTKLYMYLAYCFGHWQLDASFRMVLETWLSFIQPWRYTTVGETSSDTSLLPWKGFIKENIAFYSSLFYSFLSRALRSDFYSCGDVYLMYRVFKVFSQSALPQLLEEIDASIAQTSFLQQNSAKVGLISNWMRPQNNTSFYLQSTKNKAQQLFELIARTVDDLRNKLSSLKNNNAQYPTIFEKIKNLLSETDNIQSFHINQQQELLRYLEQSGELLSFIFQLRGPTDVSSTYPFDERKKCEWSKDNTSSLGAEYAVTSSGVQLTDKGRIQILQGLQKFDLLYSGDPELQPLRSYESETAVRYLFQAAIKINEKFAKSLERLFNRQDTLGRTLRKFSKVTQINHYTNMSISLPKQSHTPVKPRVSLRFAGSYYFMVYSGLFLLFSVLFGVGSIFSLLLLFLIMVTCVIRHVDVPPVKFKSI